MVKCAIYTRVSTDGQETSIVNQEAYLKNLLERYGCEIYQIYTDEALSGTDSKKRHSFQRMLLDGKNRKYNILLAKSYSRFGRNQRETLAALAELFESGVRIIFVEDGLDSQRDKGQFGLFAWLAEQEARKISERIKLTWQYYNKEGKIHVTTAPHGYDYVKEEKNFVVNQAEAELVRLIFRLYLQGFGVAKIAGYLNEHGYRTKNGCDWSMFVVRNILKNEFYIGSLVQGKRQTIDVTIKKMEWIEKKHWVIHKKHHEAIISEEAYFAVQEQFEKRSKLLQSQRRSRQSNVHLFSNLLWCGSCGAAMIYKCKNGKRESACYSCQKYEQRGVAGSGHRRNAISGQALLCCISTELEFLLDIVWDGKEEREKGRARKKRLAVMRRRELERKIAAKTNLSLTLLESFSQGLVGKKQYQVQNEAIEESLVTLFREKEQVMLAGGESDNDRSRNRWELGGAVLPCEENGEGVLHPECDSNRMLRYFIDRIEVDMAYGACTIFFCFQDQILHACTC